MAAVYLLSTLSTYGTSRILVRVAQRVSHDLRAELFDRMQTLPMAVFHSHTHGQLMSTYTNDIDTISNFISSSLANAITSVLGFAGILAMLLVMNPLLTLVSAAASAVLAVVLWKRLFITHPLGRWPLAVILAGAVGNLIDRAALGYVTDMFQTTFIRFAVFNVADICVVCGGIALVAYVLFGWERLEKRGDGHEQADADRPV